MGAGGVCNWSRGCLPDTRELALEQSHPALPDNHGGTEALSRGGKVPLRAKQEADPGNRQAFVQVEAWAEELQLGSAQSCCGWEEAPLGN